MSGCYGDSCDVDLGATVRKNQDGTLTITKPGLADGIVPEASPVQRPTMLH